MVRNAAFLFLKPHALTDKAKEAVAAALGEKGIQIKKEGTLEAKEIDEKMLIDKHYYAIASKATILTPDKLNVPKDKFKDKFGLDWDEALATGNVVNAKDACEKLDVEADALDSMWAGAKKAGDLVKFGGGFYCAKLSPPGKGDHYVFNGFFMAMRSKFVKEGSALYYYVVEWESESLSWADFRGKVIGPTDPATAFPESLRGMFLANWKELGLPKEPDTGDNAIHASASPFEALAERMNWLGFRVERDPFGKLLLKAGVTRKQIKEWSMDPQVTFGPVPITKPLFDSLEDTDTDYCLALCQMMAGACQLGREEEAGDLEAELAKLKLQVASYKELENAVLAIKAFVAPALPKGAKGKGKGEKVEPVALAPKKKGKAVEEECKGKSKGKGKAKPEEEERPPARQRRGKGKGKGKGKGE